MDKIEEKKKLSIVFLKKKTPKVIVDEYTPKNKG